MANSGETAPSKAAFSKPSASRRDFIHTFGLMSTRLMLPKYLSASAFFDSPPNKVAASLVQKYWDSYPVDGTSLDQHAYAANPEACDPCSIAGHKIPGLSVAVALHGQVLFEFGLGVASKDPLTRIDSDSLFRVASNSKAITSAGILLLVQQGRLNPDAPVFGEQGLLSQFCLKQALKRDCLEKITVKHLLTHTGGGWGKGKHDPMFAWPALNQNQLTCWVLLHQALEHEPGTFFEYSNFGYCVLGQVIEKISGSSYADFIEGTILKAPELRAMVLGAPIKSGSPIWSSNEVLYYASDADGDPYAFPIDRLGAAGGWVATAKDLALFHSFLFSALDSPGTVGILEPSTLRFMTTPTDASHQQYACGIGIAKDGSLNHTGSLPGSLSVFWHTKKGAICTVMQNTRDEDEHSRMEPDLVNLAKAIAELY